MKPMEVERKYINDLTLLEDAASQCEYLLMLGMREASCEEIRRDCYRIGGCKTAIWLKAWMEAGTIRLIYDSDSLLVKGVLAILKDMYTGSTPQEVAAYSYSFLDYISDEVIYPEIRHNGIRTCFQRLAALK